MNRASLRWRRLLIVLCTTWTVMLGVAPAAQAQDDVFKAGLDARTNKKWEDVAVQMRRAIQIKPQEETRKVRSGIGGILRQGGTEYLPHFFLGEALFNLQDCAGAIDEWSKSEQQMAVRSRMDFVKILQDGYAACEAKGILLPGKYEPLLTRTTQHITDVNNQAVAVVALGTANSDLWQGDAREQYERASTELKSASAHLQSAGKSHSAGDLTEANAAADRARGILATLSTNLSAAISARLSVQGQARDIEQVLGSADALDRAIEAKKASLTPALAAARQQGRDAINRAREQLSAGSRTSNAAALSEARTLAQDATTKLKPIVDEIGRIEHDALQRQLMDAATRGRQMLSLADGALVNFDRLSAQRPAAVSPDVLTKRNAIQRQVTAVHRRFDAALAAENLAGVAEATRLASAANDQLSEAISTFGPLSLADRGVHPSLIEGARLFLAGQYDQVLATLSPSAGFAPDLPLELHVHLFRAAAAYALFVRSGETNQSLREQAASEIAQCKQIDSSFEPDPRVFTPRFISVFHSGTVASGKAATAAGSQQ